MSILKREKFKDKSINPKIKIGKKANVCSFDLNSYYRLHFDKGFVVIKGSDILDMQSCVWCSVNQKWEIDE